jgi:hypothetical protein
MKLKYIIFYFSVLILPLISVECFPTYKASKTDVASLKSGNYSDIQAKVFTSDNSIIIFPDGFSVNNNFIEGKGSVTNLDSYVPKPQLIKLPVDSIMAMTTYEETTGGGRYFASFLFGLTAPPLTFLGIYCTACPKCCFGSCPTVYLYDGNKYNLQAELFSECISRQLENNDLDLLCQKNSGDTLRLKITNEALETHYINKFKVVVADHPAGTELYPAIDDKLLLVSKKEHLLSAITKDGSEVTGILLNDDNKYYRSGVDKISQLKKGPVFDWIDVKIPASRSSDTKVILKYRNTLLSTALLYNVVIGSQGIGGLAWTKKMNEDAVYASQFRMVYDAFSGIKIRIFENDEWKDLGKFKDAGPMNWKYIAAELPHSNSGTLLLRLEFVPDNFMIDYIAVDTSSLNDNEITVQTLNPVEITNGCGDRSDSLINYVANDDSKYLITEPGDSYSFSYKIPTVAAQEQTILIYSKGYYNEWIRKGWIINKDDRYTFNLFDIDGTLSNLADDWIENSELLEKEFFHSRISLKEEK